MWSCINQLSVLLLLDFFSKLFCKLICYLFCNILTNDIHEILIDAWKIIVQVLRYFDLLNQLLFFLSWGLLPLLLVDPFHNSVRCIIQNVVQHDTCRNRMRSQIVLNSCNPIEVFKILISSSFWEPFLMYFRALHFDHNVNNWDLPSQAFLETSNIVWS